MTEQDLLIDTIDEDLIRELQYDGRAQFSTLAGRVGIHRAQVAQRVQRLIDAGEMHILAAVHPRAVGLPIQANLQLRLQGPTGPVLEQLRKLPNVVFLSEITGHFQAVAEVWASDLGDLARAVRDVTACSSAVQTQFTLYDRVLRRLRLGADPDPTDLRFDDFDIALIAELQTDGRLTFGELARRTGRSASACRSRVLRLIDSGVMQIGAVRTRRSATSSVLSGVGVVVRGGSDAATAQEAVEEFLLALPSVEFAARSLGPFGIIATVAARSLAEHTSLMRTIRAHPDVAFAESWIHSHVWLERYEWSLDRLERQRSAPSV